MVHTAYLTVLANIFREVAFAKFYMILDFFGFSSAFFRTGSLSSLGLVSGIIGAKHASLAAIACSG
jgi:hypothetical protein